MIIKNKKNYIFILLPILVCLLNCKTEVSDNELKEQIEANPELAKTVELSNIIEDIAYLPLEIKGHNTYLHEDIKKIIISKERNYLFQDASSEEAVFVYDKSGKFLFKIYSQGDGPGHIYAANDFLVDERNGAIEVLDHYQHKILRYDSIGQLEQEEKLDHPYKKFIKFNTDEYVFYAGNDPFSDKNAPSNLFYKNGTTRKDFLTIPEYLRLYLIKEENFSNNINEHYLFKQILSKNIYTIKKDNIELSYQLDFGGYWIKDNTLSRLAVDNSGKNRRNLVYKHKDHIFHIVNLLETEQYIIFTYFFKEKFYWNFYDKKSKKTLSTKKIINDMDFGLVGSKTYWPLTAFENKLVFLIPAFDLKTHVEKIILDGDYEKMNDIAKSKFDNLKKVADNLLSTDNPVLVFATLKKDIVEK